MVVLKEISGRLRSIEEALRAANEYPDMIEEESGGKGYYDGKEFTSRMQELEEDFPGDEDE